MFKENKHLTSFLPQLITEALCLSAQACTRAWCDEKIHLSSHILFSGIDKASSSGNCCSIDLGKKNKENHTPKNPTNILGCALGALTVTWKCLG